MKKKMLIAILLVLPACGVQMGTESYWAEIEGTRRHANNTMADLTILGKADPSRDEAVIEHMVEHRPHEPGLLTGAVQSLSSAVDGAMNSLKRYVAPAKIEDKKKASGGKGEL